jgi:hypothetical protein
LFLQEQIKDIIIKERRRNLQAKLLSIRQLIANVALK